MPLLDRFLELCVWEPAAHRFVDFVPVGVGGGNIIFQVDGHEEAPRFRIPSASMLSESEVYFCLHKAAPLNEFGWYYVALFIAGNYARYYPDQWIADVDQKSALALAVDEILQTAANRVPLLALSELSRTYLVAQEWH